MRLLVPLALAVASVSAAATAASVTLYSIQSPDTGSCRLKGIDDSSDNFKFYASVAAKDLNSVSEGCARCIKVTKDGAATSLVAYVLDVCQGCKPGDLKLSTAALSALSIDPNLNNATASYKFTTCPTSFQSGTSVKACLMEGASNTYIPLQFYNSQKVIASANISGVAATQPKDQFFFASNPQVSNADTTQWFKEVPVILTSTDGETKSGSFAFGGTTGCATSSFQFSAASTADGNDSNGGSGGSSGKSGNNTGVIVGAVAGCVAALIIIIGSVIFVRRRRANHDFENGLHDDPAQQYLSPTAKPHAPPSPERPTYADTSMHNSTDDPSDGPESPTHDWDDASTPAASAAVAARNPYGAGHVDQYNAPPPQPPQPTYPPQQTYEPQPTYIEQQQQRQVAAAAAPKVAHQTVIAPQTFSYSKPVDNERAANNSSFRSNTSSARAAPTFPAPVLPKSRTQSSDDEDGEGRSSFDIDDLRETEELKSRERFSSLSNDLQSSVAPHSSESAYATGHVTSPQSYVRATTLRRNSSKVPERPAFRFTSSARSDAESLNSSGISERDSYASDRYHGDANAHPNTGSFRDTSSGYSRESLGILGYPYAKKPSGRSSTEAQL